MELPDGTPLMHGTRPYDPKKAHEYYMRTRKLKGRKKGQVDPKVADLAKRLRGKTDTQIRDEAEKSTDPAERKLIMQMLKNRQTIRSQNALKKVGSNSIKSGDVQKRTAKEKARSAAEAASKLKSATKEVEAASQELADLNDSLKAAKTPEEKAPLVDKLDEAKKKLEEAIKKRRSLTATKNG